MKETHFRIVELPTHQVLLTKDFDNDGDESDLIVITFFLDGVKANLTYGYNDKETRDRIFESITDEQIQSTLDGVIKTFE
jgi:hypothetical protein